MTFFRPASVALLLFAATSGHAETTQTLTLDFAPPDMAVQPICQARAPDAELIATWGGWDGKTLPDRPTSLIARDLRRLAEMDAVRWDPTIQKMILAMAKASPKFTADDVLLAQIGQMIATGQLKALTQAGLVQKLLDRGEANSPRMQFELSGLLTEGTGIAKDPAKGTELLIAAGYGGNPDALLALSQLSVTGQAPADWDISPDLAVTMAFGALVGQMDPLICDRIARIAREYTSGKVVTVDDALALRWYRFAADLGDPISAWRVVEYQLRSELVAKDNGVLLTYLKKASDAGLPYAMVTLGRLLEVGALIPHDNEAAKALYEKAAKLGDRTALVRLSGSLERQMEADPSLRATYQDTLQRLTALPDAPGWAFAKRAAMILEEQGRWKGEAEALPLWQEAAKRDDPGALRVLAERDLGRAHTDVAFYAAVDPLIQMVSNLGEVAPATDVKEAFLCKAPHAPQVRDVAYWAGVETSIGSTSVDVTPAMLADLKAKRDPLAMAALQTQALLGRSKPLANMLALLKDTDAAPSAQQFWTTFATGFSEVTTASADLALERAQTPAQRAQALALYAKAIAQGDKTAALKLASALLENPSLANRTKALDLLVPLAKAGRGQAMTLLQIADPVRYPDAKAVYTEFAAAIAAGGDFSALMLAMPFLTDPAERELYRAHAIEVMGCAFPEAIAFAGVSTGPDQADEARRWLAVATDLAGQDPWQMVVLGDAQRAALGAEGLPTAVALYEKSSDLGNKTAVQRLVKLYGIRGEPGYDAARAAKLYGALIALSDPATIPQLLAELTRRDPALAVTVSTSLDLDAMYQKAAEAGNPAGMREYARRLREVAQKPEELATATDWLIRASEAGDAKAMVMLSQAYALGVGIPPSLDLAHSWLQRAADAGDPTALDLVNLLHAQGESN